MNALLERAIAHPRIAKSQVDVGAQIAKGAILCRCMKCDEPSVECESLTERGDKLVAGVTCYSCGSIWTRIIC